MVKLTQWLTRMLAFVAGATVLLMMFHVMIDVIGKYVFNAPLPGTAEVVAAYYMIACVFLPLAWVEASGSSIVVEVVYERCAPRVQRVMLRLADVVGIVYCGIFAWFSWEVAQRAYGMNETMDGIWRITTWPAKFMLPAGFVLAMVVILLRLVLGAERGVKTQAQSLEI